MGESNIPNKRVLSIAEWNISLNISLWTEIESLLVAVIVVSL